MPCFTQQGEKGTESGYILEGELTGMTNGLYETRFLACANGWMNGGLSFGKFMLEGAI